MPGMKFARIKFTDDNIGPHLLESITKGLYVNPLHAIREYVQNEVEAEPAATTIKVYVGGKEISVWGNGGGMNRDTIMNSAMKIGFSKKDPTKHFGFRGIGIWSGVAVCNTILISTKRTGESKKYFVRIDAKNIREEIRRKTKKLTMVLTENVQIAETPSPRGQHGSHVRLIGILEESRKYLLSRKDVAKYMRQVLPLDFEPNFKYKNEITRKLRQNVPNYKTVKVFLGRRRVYRAPFIKDLDRPEFRLLKAEGEVLAFCWFCMHKYKKLIGDAESRGLVYKKYGFTVGDRNVCLNWWEKSKHLPDWCVGEIHAVHLNILPNAERIDFESSQEKDLLVSQLKKVVQVDVIDASRKKSHFDLMRQRVNEVFDLPQKAAFASPTERAEAISEVHTLQKRLVQAQKHKYTREFASSREKQKLKEAIKKTEKLVKSYAVFPMPEGKKAPEPAQPMETTKTPGTFEVEVKPSSSYVSFSDLLDEIQLKPESQAILQAMEEVLDEYYAKDPGVGNEIKQSFASKIKELLGD